jgi:hypothetical protein
MNTGSTRNMALPTGMKLCADRCLATLLRSKLSRSIRRWLALVMRSHTFAHRPLMDYPISQETNMCADKSAPEIFDGISPEFVIEINKGDGCYMSSAGFMPEQNFAFLYSAVPSLTRIRLRS